MNYRAKGNAREKAVQEIFEARGYLVDRARSSGFAVAGGKWLSRSNDFFGVFDLACTEANDFVYVQVTTEKGASARRKKIRDVANHFSSTIGIELWIERTAWVEARGNKRKAENRWRIQLWQKRVREEAATWAEMEVL